MARLRGRRSEARRDDDAVRGVRPQRESTEVLLSCRGPIDWQAMLQFLEARAIPGIEYVEGGEYLRTVAVEGSVGWIAASLEPGPQAAVRVRLASSLAPHLSLLVNRLRHAFDLDAEPKVIREWLSRDPRLSPLLRDSPGLRLPGAVDGFELAVRAILGQQVSVQAATTLSGRLAAAIGSSISSPHPRLTRAPISADSILDLGAPRLAALGLPRARAESIAALARAHAEGSIRLEPGTDRGTGIRDLQSIRGIGPWTAEYIAMRALHRPDAFPHHDLVLRRRLGGLSPSALREAAEPWRPWRAYAAMHLWHAGGRPRLRG